ncbi:Polyubiquitin [Aphelenchoides bicaudatus]|nr:Polyubiquitin [Aphelenchoides bicaudatus]
MLKLGVSLSLLLAILAFTSSVNANLLLRHYECNVNERHKSITIFENKTIDFTCSKIVCGNVELKLDDERNCTNNELELVKSNRSKCSTSNLATIKHVGVQILELGQFYSGGVVTNGSNSYFDFIASHEFKNDKVVVRIDRLTCKDATVRALSHEVEEILVKNVEDQPAYSIQTMWTWFKEHLLYVKPQEHVLFVNKHGEATKLIVVEKEATVDDLKASLQKVFNYPADQQALYFDGLVLSENKKLTDYNVCADSSLRLEIFEKLHLMYKHGKMSNFLIKQNFTFDELAQVIQKQTDILTANQQIHFEGELLTVESFKQNEIHTGSILVVDERKYLDNVDDLSADDLFSRAEKHFGFSTGYYYTTQIKLNGKDISKDSKLSEQGIQDGSILMADYHRRTIKLI